MRVCGTSFSGLYSCVCSEVGTGEGQLRMCIGGLPRSCMTVSGRLRFTEFCIIHRDLIAGHDPAHIHRCVHAEGNVCDQSVLVLVAADAHIHAQLCQCKRSAAIAPCWAVL